jgi:hypothetical protein
MAALSPVVHSLASVVNGSEPHLLQSRRIGIEMVGDEMGWSKAQLLQKVTHQFLGGGLIMLSTAAKGPGQWLSVTSPFIPLSSPVKDATSASLSSRRKLLAID